MIPVIHSFFRTIIVLVDVVPHVVSCGIRFLHSPCRYVSFDDVGVHRCLLVERVTLPGLKVQTQIEVLNMNVNLNQGG